MVSVELVLQDAGRFDWSPVDPELLALDTLVAGDYHVITLRLDGTQRTDLTPTFRPNRHKGQPAWHPSGTALVMQVENDFGFHTIATSPGSGINNDLYLLPVNGTAPIPLRQMPVASLGVLHPHFSHDGQTLFWAELVTPRSGATFGGDWRLFLADYVATPTPHLENVRSHEPNGVGWYESHGFDAVDGRVFFTHVPDGSEQLDVYSMAVDGTGVVRHTNDAHWDEHAWPSPGGTRMAWMSSRFLTGWNGSYLSLRTEVYMQDLAGGNVEQLTAFNEGSFTRFVAADLMWNSTGDAIMVYVHSGNGSSEELHLIRLNAAY